MVALPGMFDLPTRAEYLPPPGSDFIVDVAGETPMRQMALQSVARERDNMYRNRLAASGPPTPNPSTVSGTPGGVPNPSLGMPPALEGNEAARQPGNQTMAQGAGPRLLSPPDWAAKFMPNLANQQYISSRQRRLLDDGYKAYAGQVKNDQDRADSAMQEARYNRQYDATERREGRMEKRYDIQDERAERQETARERRHNEDLASREAIANRRAELSPQETAFNRAMEGYLAEHPGDYMGALSAASLAMKGGAGAGSDNPMNALTAKAIAEQEALGKTPTDILGIVAQEKRAPERDASLLDKGEFSKKMSGGALGPGLANDEEAWAADSMGQFKKYADYVRTTMATASPAERKLMHRTILQKAPYKTADEVRAAYAAGKFDPPAKSGFFWSGGPGFGGGISDDARKQGAKQAAEEYLQLISTPE